MIKTYHCLCSGWVGANYCMRSANTLPFPRSAPFVVLPLSPSSCHLLICDVLFNMKAVLSAQLAILDTRRPFRSGVTIMMDEVAGEGQACYFPHADCAGGFCREHCASVDTRLTTFDNAVNLVRRLQDGTLHYGKEVSVITIGSFGQVLHGAYPVLISPCARLSRLRGLRA